MLLPWSIAYPRLLGLDMPYCTTSTDCNGSNETIVIHGCRGCFCPTCVLAKKSTKIRSATCPQTSFLLRETSKLNLSARKFVTASNETASCEKQRTHCTAQRLREAWWRALRISQQDRSTLPLSTPSSVLATECSHTFVLENRFHSKYRTRRSRSSRVVDNLV